MGFDLGAAFEAGLNNAVSTISKTNVSNVNTLKALARHEAVLGTANALLEQGAIGGEATHGVLNAVTKATNGQELSGADGQALLRGLVQGTYRNPDGSPNGEMDPNILALMESTVNALDPNAPGFTLRDGTTEGIKNIAKGFLWDLAKRDQNVGRVLSDALPGTWDQILGQVLNGDLLGAGQAAILGAFLPHLAMETLREYFPWIGGLGMLGFRPPILNENGQIIYTVFHDNSWSTTPAPVQSVLPPPLQGNVGKKGHMEVSLGGAKFEIPPATQSLLPVHGATGQSTPGAEAGISFRHIQNYATLLIPGSSPVYQSLGISGHQVEFVGVFLGFDASRRLNADLNAPGAYDVDGPDPFYSSDNLKGGAWSISRGFQQKVEKGLPLEFVIHSGIATIKYQLIVTTMRRLYQRDDRVYYQIQGLAVGGTEGGDSNKPTTLPQRATKVTKPKRDSGQNRVAKSRTGGSKPKTGGKSSTSKPVANNPKSIESVQSLVVQAEIAVKLLQTTLDGPRVGSTFATRLQNNHKNAAVKIKLARDGVTSLQTTTGFSTKDGLKKIQEHDNRLYAAERNFKALAERMGK